MPVRVPTAIPALTEKYFGRFLGLKKKPPNRRASSSAMGSSVMDSSVVRHQADTMRAMDVADRDVSTMRPMKMKNLEAAQQTGVPESGPGFSPGAILHTQRLGPRCCCWP